MDLDADFLGHDLLITDEPTVLHAEHSRGRIRLAREPALELKAHSAQAPRIVFLIVDFDVRPRPIKSAMIVVILGKVVGQNLPVQTVKRMKIGGTALRVWRLHAADDAVIVHENWLVAFPEAKRFVVDSLESESCRRWS
jgi:hypothetical protein